MTGTASTEAAVPRRPAPPFTDRHEALRSEIRAFVAEELRPHAAEWEQARWFPDSVFRRMAELGLLGLKYPVEYGGRGGGYVEDAVLTQELSRCGSGGLAAGIGAHIGIATPPVWKFGTEDQKQRFLAPAIRGERIAALGITEPGAGSDVAGIRTFARRVDGGYLVNGAKTFITNGMRADFVVTAVKTTEEGGHQGISFLVIEKGMEGFSVAGKLEKLGWHASDTAELSFEDVFVPEENLLGDENRGFYLIMANFQWERLLMALGAVGSMEAVLERVVEEAQGRAEFRHTVAELAVKLEASRALTGYALYLFAGGHDAIREVTEAKLLSQRSAVEVAEAAFRITDGDLEIGRALRDTRLGRIGGGTDEVMKEILGKLIGL
ncbi:MAG TPA: acyl-CoA dehydrogenase family protein [Thermoleophilaceae bacterium]|jgi:acyl-CoA dehydrogenase|nr:acyl-CoA dehydrogenase family protein [Thermoleophilaceae bacterium]